MAHKEVGEKEKRNRELAQQKRIEMNKRLIDAADKVGKVATKVKAKAVGRVERLKMKKVGRRGG